MEPRTLVVIFLRGGLDGLVAVAPTFEDEYRRLRPMLGTAAPKPGATGPGPSRLDDRFTLHAALAPLLPSYREGRLAIVHAVGSDDSTRSHFEAQDQMDHGATCDHPLPGGWIARWLRAAGERGAMSAVAFGRALPESLRGAPSACAVESLADLSVRTQTGDGDGFAQTLATLHGDGAASSPSAALVCRSARDSLALLDRIGTLRTDAAAAASAYPRTELGLALAQIALLVRKEVGLRAAAIDHGGFDTHYGQAYAIGTPLEEFAGALAAFDRDLGDLRERVTTVCITEFGRRAYENASLGTDHGRASCAFLLGGGVRGGRVHGAWPGLSEAELEDPGDLRVTTDYRDILWEALSRRFGASDVASVFPGLTPRPCGVLG